MVSVERCKLMCSFIKHTCTTYELRFCRIKSMNSALSYRVLRIRLSRGLLLTNSAVVKTQFHQFKGSTASIILQLCISKLKLIHSYQKFLHQKRREKDYKCTRTRMYHTCVHIHACIVYAYMYTHVLYMCTHRCMYHTRIHVNTCIIPGAHEGRRPEGASNYA